MSPSVVLQRRDNESLTRTLAVVTLGLLLFLRFGVLTAGAMLIPAGSSSLGWVYELGTYILTLALIWLSRDRLSEFNIDGVALVLLLIAKPTETLVLSYWDFTDLPMAFPHVSSIAVIGLTAVTALALAFSKKARVSWRWSSVLWWLGGGLVGALVAAALAYPLSLQNAAVRGTSLDAQQFFRFVFPVGFVYQTGYAATSEEPLFRAFLWGYLLRLGVKPALAWILIAFSFVVAHLYYFGRAPWSLFLVVPVGALVLGLAAWKTRTIASSMGIHGMMNATGQFFAGLVAQVR